MMAIIATTSFHKAVFHEPSLDLRDHVLEVFLSLSCSRSSPFLRSALICNASTPGRIACVLRIETKLCHHGGDSCCSACNQCETQFMINREPVLKKTVACSLEDLQTVEDTELARQNTVLEIGVSGLAVRIFRMNQNVHTTTGLPQLSVCSCSPRQKP